MPYSTEPIIIIINITDELNRHAVASTGDGGGNAVSTKLLTVTIVGYFHIIVAAIIIIIEVLQEETVECKLQLSAWLYGQKPNLKTEMLTLNMDNNNWYRTWCWLCG